MPAVWITLDHIDGTSKIRGPLYPDEIDLTGLLFRLNERDLATVTFTRANPLKALQEATHEHDKEGINCDRK
jgi:hypothetical protein